MAEKIHWRPTPAVPIAPETQWGPTRAAPTVEEMQRVQWPALDASQAITWRYGALDSPELLGHSGADIGTSAVTAFWPKTGTGVIVLTNGDAYEAKSPSAKDALDDIATRLLTTFAGS